MIPTRCGCRVAQVPDPQTFDQIHLDFKLPNSKRSALMSNMDRLREDGNPPTIDFDSSDAGERDQLIKLALKMLLFSAGDLGDRRQQPARTIELTADSPQLNRELLDTGLALAYFLLYPIAFQDAVPRAGNTECPSNVCRSGGVWFRVHSRAIAEASPGTGRWCWSQDNRTEGQMATDLLMLHAFRQRDASYHNAGQSDQPCGLDRCEWLHYMERVRLLVMEEGGSASVSDRPGIDRDVVLRLPQVRPSARGS